MRDSKFGLRAFGLALVAALGLMAFLAIAAQAANLSNGGEPGLFLSNGVPTTAGTTFSVTQLGTGILLVPTRVDLLCTGGTVTGEFKSDTEALGGATFTGCTAWSPVGLKEEHKILLPCTVLNAAGQEGVVTVEKAIALSKLHEKEPYVLLEEDGKGTPFTTVFFHGKECTLPKENKITGSVVGKIDKSGTVEPLVLFSEEIQKLFQVGTEGDHLKFGTLESYIDGEGHAKLTDAAHLGQTIGIC